MHRFWVDSAWFSLLRSSSPAARLMWVMSCALLLWAAHASAEQVQLAWDAINAPTLAGYRLYYGQTSSTYTTYIDVGLQTTATVTDLTPGQLYFFVVTAYDTAGDESDPSNTVSMTISSDTLGVAANTAGNESGPANTVSPNISPDTLLAPAARDLDGDGKADLVWRHTVTGQVAVWLLNG